MLKVLRSDLSICVDNEAKKHSEYVSEAHPEIGKKTSHYMTEVNENVSRRLCSIHMSMHLKIEFVK